MDPTNNDPDSLLREAYEYRRKVAVEFGRIKGARLALVTILAAGCGEFSEDLRREIEQCCDLAFLERSIDVAAGAEDPVAAVQALFEQETKDSPTAGPLLAHKIVCLMLVMARSSLVAIEVRRLIDECSDVELLRQWVVGVTSARDEQALREVFGLAEPPPDWLQRGLKMRKR